MRNTCRAAEICLDFSCQKPGDRPKFRKKRSRSEKATLGSLGPFRVILGAALGVQELILGMRNAILAMASHDLCNAKPQFSEQLPERCPELMGTHMEDVHLPMHSRSVFFLLGWSPRARSCLAHAFQSPRKSQARTSSNMAIAKSPNHLWGKKRHKSLF